VRTATTLAGAVAAAVLLYVVVMFLGPLAIRLVLRIFAATLDAIVWLIVAAQSGLDTWGILTRAGSTILRSLATFQVTTVLVGIEAIAALALYVLYRMLSQEKESGR
jgi:hypothetical protein